MFVGRVADTGEHSHYAIQVGLALGEDFGLMHGGTLRSYGCVVVPSGVSHELRAGASGVALLYFDPTGVLGEQLSRRYTVVTDLTEALGGGRSLWQGPDSSVDMHALLRAVETALVPDLSPVSQREPRIQQVVALLDDDVADELDVTRLAAVVGLSAGRLRHLFRQQLGIPIRSYRLWRRMRRAVELIPAGGTLTEVAHAAGFADSAHLSRAFRQLFGVTPSQLFPR